MPHPKILTSRASRRRQLIAVRVRQTRIWARVKARVRVRVRVSVRVTVRRLL